MTSTLQISSLDSDPYTRRAFSELSLSVAKSRKIVLVTGAGISCSSGIPDFRSSDGLYSIVKERYPSVVLRGRDLFDASLFRDATTTAVFYTFISQLKESIDRAVPTATHRFIKTLDTKKKLLRCYTQNIDGLEEQVGLLGSSSDGAKSSGKGKQKLKIKDVRNVQLHGDIHRVRCTSCSAEYQCTREHMSVFDQGSPPDCPECSSRLEARVARSARPTRVGSLRPAIVLYDEPHPLGDDIGSIQAADLARKPDMLIIMGTSLKVHGLRKLVKDFAKVVHATAPSGSTNNRSGKVIFVNKTPPSAEWANIIDYHVCGETDAWVDKVIMDWRKLRPSDWEIQQSLIANGDTDMSNAFKSAKSVSSSKGKEKVSVSLQTERENVPTNLSANKPSLGMKNTNTTVETAHTQDKRRSASSHYNNLEFSPSKKRVSRPKNVVNDRERKLLFAESTNNRPNPTFKDIFDIPVQEIEAVAPKLGRIKAPRAKLKGAGKTGPRLTKSVLSATKKKRGMRKTARKNEHRRQATPLFQQET